MTKKNTHKILTIFLIITASLIATNNIEAVRLSIPTMGGGGGGNKGLPKASVKVRDKHRIDCEYNPHYGYDPQIDINAYDMEGNSIIPYSHISLSKFKAGTWIGINLREFKFSSWNTEIVEYKEIAKKYLCPMTLSEKGIEERRKCEEKNKKEYEEYLKEKEEYPKKVETYHENHDRWEEEIARWQEKMNDCTAKSQEECGEDSGLDCKNSCAAIANSYPPEPQYPKPPVYFPDECVSCEDAKMIFPYYFMEERNFSFSSEYCYPEWWEAVTFDKIIPPLEDHSEDICIFIGHTSYMQDVELEALRPTYRNPITMDEFTTKVKEEACDTEAVRETVRGGLGLLYPNLQFEVIDPNNYKKDNLNMLTFDNPKTLRQKDTIKVEGEPQNLIVSEDTNHVRTKMPENFQKYIDDINERNYTQYMQRQYHATYEHNIDNTCINVKTGNVYYDGGICGKNSVEIKRIKMDVTKDKYLNNIVNPDEDVKYWHYFIPLDTHTSYSESNDVGFFIRVSNKSSKIVETKDCITVLTRYPIRENDQTTPNYMNWITPISTDGTDLDFVGDYYAGTKNSDSRDMQLFESQAYQCRFSIKIKFNVEQKFYGEEVKDTKQTIKGYGFYYRSIDPKKPFPNGVAIDSVWSGLYDASNNKITTKNNNNKEITINLNDSFETITYSTKELPSLNQVRKEINNDNKYTSWQHMDPTNGQSNFVKNYKLRRDVSLKEIYKLGCGPDNLDWEGCK